MEEGGLVVADTKCTCISVSGVMGGWIAKAGGKFKYLGQRAAIARRRIRRIWFDRSEEGAPVEEVSTQIQSSSADLAT